MKEFFKMLAAVVVGLLLFGFIGFMILFGIASAAQKDKKVSIEANSVLTIDMTVPVPERTTENGLDPSNLKEIGEKKVGLNDILSSIQKAKTDGDIKGIYLPLGDNPNGYATNEAVRNALKDFSKSGKFIIAYGNGVTQKDYYFATVANKIYLTPEGGIELMGFGTRMMFFKNMLDKIGVSVQAFHRGTFKSAFDPLVRTDMSDANRLQITELLGDFYKHFLDEVSSARKIDKAALSMYIDSVAVQNPDDAYRLKMIDGEKYYDEVLAELAEKSGLKSTEAPKFVKVKDYMNLDEDPDAIKVGGGKIAVIFASGNIVDGQGEDDEIGGDGYAKVIRKLREDDNVKAIVLRVNSGGGSALASDIIWREVCLAKAKKPFIVSFGDVAASGGYYISCNADRIFAQPNTITGSIGVFGLIPNAQVLLNDKLGVTTDEVRLNPHAVMNAGVKPLDDFESRMIQKSIDSVYHTFLSRVANGRKSTLDVIETKAEGRVWSGTAAIKIGLVDEIGGLDDAVAYAAKKANLKSYRTVSYPKEKSLIDKLLEGMKGDSQVKYVEKEYGIDLKAIKSLHDIMRGGKIQARMPYVMEVE
jgi:protease IV